MKEILRRFATPLGVGLVLMLVCLATQTAAQGGFRIMQNYGLERGDYKDFDLSRPMWEDCRDACAREDACLSFTYTIPIPGPNGRPAHCWLKNIVPRGEGRDWCISGIKITCSSNSYSIDAPDQVPTGSRFKVTFTYRGARPQGNSDWIGIIVPGRKEYRDWTYVSYVQGCETMLTAPAPGVYELQYIMAGDSWPVAARKTIRVN